MSNKVKELINGEKLQINQDKIVVLDFYSPTCGPCKMLSFILNDVAKEFASGVEFIKINFNENKMLCEEYKVTGYPTLIFFSNGAEYKRMQGLQAKSLIQDTIKEKLS